MLDVVGLGVDSCVFWLVPCWGGWGLHVTLQLMGGPDAPEARAAHSTLFLYAFVRAGESVGVNSAGVALSATESIYNSKAALAADPYVTDSGVIEDAIPSIILPQVRFEASWRLLLHCGGVGGNGLVWRGGTGSKFHMQRQ